MKTLNKVTLSILIVAFLLAGQTYAYPPDNAAVLYYRALLMLPEPNEAVASVLGDAAKGIIEPNEQVLQYLDECRNTLKYARAASKIDDCDWGFDLSEGIEMVFSPLSQFRRLAYLQLVQARLLLKAGDLRGTLEECFVLHTFARHVGNDTIISCLVGVSINGLANDCIADVLGEMGTDIETLAWLKSRLAGASQRVPSFRPALANEVEVMAAEIRKDRLEVILENIGPDILARQDIAHIERLRGADDTFFTASRMHYVDHAAAFLAAYDLPYSQSYNQLNAIKESLDKQASEKFEAVLSAFLAPAVARSRTLDARRQTQFNALIAAIDIYLNNARNGKLPDELPAGLPKDMFSGKDFLYEKTDVGFALNCQGKDLDKDVVHQYEFKVPK